MRGSRAELFCHRSWGLVGVRRTCVGESELTRTTQQFVRTVLILRHTPSLSIQVRESETRGTVFEIARALQQFTRSRKIDWHAAASAVHRRKIETRLWIERIARAGEQRDGTRIVRFDALTEEIQDRELAAAFRKSGV